MKLDDMKTAGLVAALNLQEDLLSENPSPDCVENALRAVREFLNMEVAFVSEFCGDKRIFTHVDASGDIAPISPGQEMALDAGFCLSVVKGHVPELIPDTSELPEAVAIAETHALPIGAHASVPIRFSDGSIYGTFCCFSSSPDPTLNERDLQVMKAVANMVAFHLEADLEANRARSEKLDRIRHALTSGQPLVLYQPVMDLKTGKIVGAEALGRFKSDPTFAPDRWFADAADVDLRSELETAAIKNALIGFQPSLELTNLHLAINIGPLLSMEGGLADIFADFPADRLVIEITEHDIINDYDLLEASLEPLRARGVRIAADDVGAGFANMRHIMKLRPDIIKLDASLTNDVHTDLVQKALVAGIMEFAKQAGCEVVAEGIETEEQLNQLREFGVHMGQGFFIARPGSLEDLCQRIRG